MPLLCSVVCGAPLARVGGVPDPGASSQARLRDQEPLRLLQHMSVPSAREQIIHYSNNKILSCADLEMTWRILIAYLIKHK